MVLKVRKLRALWKLATYLRVRASLVRSRMFSNLNVENLAGKQDQTAAWDWDKSGFQEVFRESEDSYVRHRVLFSDMLVC